MNATLFSANGFSCVSCSFECFTEHEAMNSDSQIVISIGVSKFSSLRSRSTNELVNILAADPMILFSSKDANPFELSFDALPWLAMAWTKLSKETAMLSSVPEN